MVIAFRRQDVVSLLWQPFLHPTQVLEVALIRRLPVAHKGFGNVPAMRYDMTVKERKVGPLLMAIGREIQPGIQNDQLTGDENSVVNAFSCSSRKPNTSAGR